MLKKLFFKLRYDSYLNERKIRSVPCWEKNSIYLQLVFLSFEECSDLYCGYNNHPIFHLQVLLLELYCSCSMEDMDNREYLPLSDCVLQTTNIKHSPAT